MQNVSPSGAPKKNNGAKNQKSGRSPARTGSGRPRRRPAGNGPVRNPKAKQKTKPSATSTVKATPKPPEHEVVYLEVPNKKIEVMFFDTLAQAKAAKESLLEIQSRCDQLNIVIKAEGSQYEDELSKIGKLFVGEAWYLIHQRRLEEGWYGKT